MKGRKQPGFENQSTPALPDGALEAKPKPRKEKKEPCMTLAHFEYPYLFRLKKQELRPEQQLKKDFDKDMKMSYSQTKLSTHEFDSLVKPRLAALGDETRSAAQELTKAGISNQEAGFFHFLGRCFTATLVQL